MPSDILPHSHDQATKKLFQQMPETIDFQTLSLLFKQLSDPSRIRIFWILCHCEECVIDLSSLMDMSSPAVAHHLKLLRTSSLIQCWREGKEVYYKAADTVQARQLHKIIEQMIEISCPQRPQDAQETGRPSL